MNIRPIPRFRKEHDHGNQTRGDGITLADVYLEDGEVLMGTLRSQQEAQTAETRRFAAEERVRTSLQRRADDPARNGKRK